jgi:hypothetical protein
MVQFFSRVILQMRADNTLILPPPLPKFWWYLCLYQNVKVPPFIGNKGMKPPYVWHKGDFLPPFLKDFSKNLPPSLGRTTYYYFQDPFRENILPALNITLFYGSYGSDR